MYILQFCLFIIKNEARKPFGDLYLDITQVISLYIIFKPMHREIYTKKYCDIQTKDDIWRVGIIKEIQGDVYIIALDGWSATKNQVFCY